MASITVGDWFRVTGPKRADGSASWWMGKPGGWQPRAFDGVWPSGQLIREHVLNIDFSQDFQALEVFRTSSAKFVQARVEIPDPRGPPGGVRSFWFNVAKYGEDWVTILPQHASGGGSSDQSRSAGGWWSRAAASGVSAEAAQDASGAGSSDQYWSRSGGGWWSRVAASDISAEAAQDASGGGSADQSWSRGGWWSRVAASDVSAEAAQDASGAGGGWWSRYEGWAGWGGNRRGAGGPPEAQPEYLCPTCGGAAFWDINCCIRWCPRCSVASDVESAD